MRERDRKQSAYFENVVITSMISSFLNVWCGAVWWYLNATKFSHTIRVSVSIVLTKKKRMKH